jgi:glutathione synthase/RimK-type ligase-like ATP-grasp enzyme
MKTLFVVDRRNEWSPTLSEDVLVAAEDYLTDPGYNRGRYQCIVNLCSCDRQQGKGHYVSLVAEARGQDVLPSVTTIEDVNAGLLHSLLPREIGALLQAALPRTAQRETSVETYFGHDPSGRHATISRRLFELVKAPFLRATFERAGSAWKLQSIALLDPSAIAEKDRNAAVAAAGEFLARSRRSPSASRESGPYSVAILRDSNEADSPTNPLALEHFIEAARALDMRAAIIDRHALDRIESFDGLFIRDTTMPGHYTYEFARRAAAAGLVVIDDPDSILQCNNKVYLHELLERHHVPMPKSALLHRDNAAEVAASFGFPCILKEPASAFSRGVSKVESAEALPEVLERLLGRSDLVIAQEYIRTDFDWRVGILDRRVLFVCKYFMAPHHWQVIKRDAAGRVEGRTVAVSVGEAPGIVVQTALRAANLIGAGFYGVDLKQTESACYVMEVNDNPNVDAGNEDQVMGPALYREVMGVIKRRIEESRQLAVAA